MTISTAILATLPFLYYKLDESSGATAADLGSGGHPGTYSGDLTLGVPGPEVNTGALRMFLSGQVQSTALGINLSGDFSLGFWAAMKPGASNTAANFLWIGNPIFAVGGRGIVVRHFDSSTAPDYELHWAPGTAAITLTPSAPQFFWHYYVYVWNSAGNQIFGSVDGNNLGTAGAFSSTRPLAFGGDPLVIAPTYDIVLAHVAFWQRQLSNAEIASIGAFAQSWPYSPPAYLPVTSSGSPIPDTAILGDLSAIQTAVNAVSTAVTAVQTAVDAVTTTVNTLESQVTGIITTSLPSLGTGLSNVISGITSTVTSGASSVSRTVGQLLSGKVPQDWTEVELTTGCTGGDVSFSLAYFVFGLRVLICTFPPGEAQTQPGGVWHKPAFAAVRVRRGSSYIFDELVNVLDWQIDHMPGVLDLGFTPDLNLPIAPPDLVVEISFAVGVTGQVYRRTVV